jgi:superfamily II DNA/RNA helicase
MLQGVNTVINVDPPPSVPGYVHRVGRTGRAGAAGTAITLVTPDDKTLEAELMSALQPSTNGMLACIYSP